MDRSSRSLENRDVVDQARRGSEGCKGGYLEHLPTFEDEDLDDDELMEDLADEDFADEDDDEECRTR